MSRQYSPDVLQAIAERAYYMAEKQGFTPGQEVTNWLAAEREILGRRLDHKPLRTSSATSRSTGKTKRDKPKW